MTTWLARRATGSSTRWSPAATRTQSRPGCAHHDAGADHVCIYVVGGVGEELPLDAWRRLAPVLTGLG
jgi:hypothetical protein